jgi:proline iminopeptidase
MVTGMPEKPFQIDTGSGTLAGAEAGQGPDLLLLHGGPGLSDYTDLLYGETDGWRAIRYQQRGIAPSAPGGPFTVARHVADAIAVLDGLGVGRAVILGHSWGAHLALQVAVAAPDRVAGLVLVDGLGVADPDGGASAFGQNLVSRIPEADLALLGQRAAERGDRPPTGAEATADLAVMWRAYFADGASAPPMPAGITMSAQVNVETLASVAESLAGGFAARLAAVTVPAVLVAGGAGPMPLSVAEQVAGLLPAAETVVIPEGAHLPWHERPGCVAAALAAVRERAGGR